MRSTRDMDAGRKQDVALDVDGPQMTARPDVDVVVNPRVDLREQGAELNRHRGGAAAAEDAREKGAAEILAGQTGYQRQYLGRAGKGAVAAHQQSADLERGQLRQDDDRR